MNHYLGLSIVAIMVACTVFAWLSIKKKKDLRGVILLVHGCLAVLFGTLLYSYVNAQKILYPQIDYSKYIYFTGTWISKISDAASIVFIFCGFLLFTEYRKYKQNPGKYVEWYYSEQNRSIYYFSCIFLLVMPMLMIFDSPSSRPITSDLYNASSLTLFYLMLMWSSYLGVRKRVSAARWGEKSIRKCRTGEVRLLFMVLGTLFASIEVLSRDKNVVVISFNLLFMVFTFLLVIDSLINIEEKNREINRLKTKKTN
ncbi:MAG: hypothetical protein A2231_05365 [Candidatus Firestonebacteria bacterium RIFOXYA2_FULL_40_8]|nr:MAG: hypothetical protein A2231_05365 [Candidatus Firestonebacteria bacterium RIFOXYA2_FULL_40_8]